MGRLIFIICGVKDYEIFKWEQDWQFFIVWREGLIFRLIFYYYDYDYICKGKYLEKLFIKGWLLYDMVSLFICVCLFAFHKTG